MKMVALLSVLQMNKLFVAFCDLFNCTMMKYYKTEKDLLFDASASRVRKVTFKGPGFYEFKYYQKSMSNLQLHF